MRLLDGVPAAWDAANQQYLMAHVRRVRALVQNGDAAEAARDVDAAARILPAPGAIDVLCDRFALSAFERDIVLLAAAPELSGEGSAVPPTFSLALARFETAHWSALTPAAALRSWRLVELAPGYGLCAAPLTLDERILHYLAGVNYLDEPVARLFTPLEAQRLGGAYAAHARTIAAHWAAGDGGAGPAAKIEICARDGSAARAIVAAAASLVGATAWVLAAADLPAGVAERIALARSIRREQRLCGIIVVLDVHSTAAPDTAWRPFVETLAGPVAILARSPAGLQLRELVRFEVPELTSSERRALWIGAFAGSGLNAATLDPLATQFKLSSYGVAAIANEARATGALEPRPLWDAARRQARLALDDVAQRIATSAALDDVILPAPQIELLEQIALALRHRQTVYETWGFGRVGRGLGLCALFSGQSGTGKTFAAEALAGHLELDLYRIDLASTVSKYIGETEKNLRRIFDAAESGGAILLFDEADALFGKRSEVRDSHDRYANIEVSYLLQRIEAYDGLAILTTNLKTAIDSAFLRRLRFIVHFPFPGFAERLAIWQRVFPNDVPSVDVDFARLARLNVAGASIRNIALGAAFFAAGDGAPVTMAQLARAARAEFTKMDKALPENELAAWT